jgi:hypothetical protein
MYVCSSKGLGRVSAGVFIFWLEAAMEKIGRYRVMASMCRLQAVLDPKNARRWLFRADRWESLVTSEIEDHYRECNTNREAA